MNHKLLTKKLAILEKLAVRDELTGIYNYRYFHDTLTNEMYRAKRYKRPLCLMVIDIDYFKELNDTKGHKAGDRAIKKLAETLTGYTRKSNTVCRYGGDEFVIILPETKNKDADILAKRLKKVVKQKVKVSISIGVSCFPKNGKTVNGLFNSADKALYKIKKNRDSYER